MVMESVTAAPSLRRHGSHIRNLPPKATPLHAGTRDHQKTPGCRRRMMARVRRELLSGTPALALPCAPMSTLPHHVVNLQDVEEVDCRSGDHWGGFEKQLTPSMRPKGGRLGVNHLRLPKGHTMCPFHYHELEDEVFLVLAGRGILRYGDDVHELHAGDCVSCPAGTKTAHQIGNPFDEDLVYLSIGPRDPHEVCVYPDSNKVLVRSLRYNGFLEQKPYLEGEPSPPKILDLRAPKG
jgi:uncharacterized cupin superfamily protein